MKNKCSLAKTIVLLSLLLAILAGCGPRDFATQEKYNRLQKGMTLTEIESVMGGPGEPIKVFQVKSATGDPPFPKGEAYSWTDKDGAYITVNLSDGKMFSATPHKLK
jgi:hypothetical protein